MEWDSLNWLYFCCGCWMSDWATGGALIKINHNHMASINLVAPSARESDDAVNNNSPSPPIGSFGRLFYSKIFHPTTERDSNQQRVLCLPVWRRWISKQRQSYWTGELFVVYQTKGIDIILFTHGLFTSNTKALLIHSSPLQLHVCI